MTTIAITGASGKLGRATLTTLLSSKSVPASNLVAVVRDPAKLGDVALAGAGGAVRTADYTNQDSLTKAFKGVDRLVFISTSALGDERMLHHGNVVKAARAAGVKHIIYTSVVKPLANAKFGASPGHFHTEALIRDAGIAHTFFRNNLYLDILPMFAASALETGRLVHSTGGGRVGFVARNDIAEALAKVAAGTGHEGKEYPITTSGRAYTFADIADAVGQATGKPIESVDLTPDAFKKGLEAAGLAPPMVAMSSALHAAVRDGEFDVSDSSLEKLLGRAPLSLQGFATGAFGKR